jgi:hypothetical protein
MRCTSLPVQQGADPGVAQARRQEPQSAHEMDWS